jgi:hypothetical protein
MALHVGYQKERDAERLAAIANGLGMRDVQHYTPMLERFFVMTKANCDHVVLDSHERITACAPLENGVTAVTTQTRAGAVEQRRAFVKFSPLLDPVDHIGGKYAAADLTKLPTFGDGAGCHPKVASPHNAAYVDSLFSFLSSELAEEHALPNIVKYFGAFCGIKVDYRYDMADDLATACESQFFRDGLGTTFELEGIDLGLLSPPDSRACRRPLQLGATSGPTDYEPLTAEALERHAAGCLTEATLQVSDHPPLKLRSASCSESCDSASSHSFLDQESPQRMSLDSASTTSGRSNTRDAGESDDSESESDSRSDNDPHCIMRDFPCMAIGLEPLEGTLDDLMWDTDMSADHWASALFQVVAALGLLHASFDLTHNDLHTSNVMYTATDAKYIFYRTGGELYKVPTYGRVFKIIDFGRAIYTFKGRRFCSDNFQEGDAAAGQYNCEPFYDPARPRIEPNPSFDLGRFGCSLYEYFFDEPDSLPDEADPLSSMVMRWVCAGTGKNMLYKADGDERYPGFKLYKMLARRAKGLEPQHVLATEQVFQQMRVPGDTQVPAGCISADHDAVTQKEGSSVNTTTGAAPLATPSDCAA